MNGVSARAGKSGMLWHKTVLTLLLVYLFLPLGATLLFSIASDWQNNVLPDSYTLQWYAQLFGDPRFIEAIGRTVLVGVVTVIASLIVMVPVIFVLGVYFPKWERVLQMSMLLPFAFPGVVSAIGLIKMYSSGPFPITGTIWILIGVYFIGIQPFIYQSVRNSLGTINAKDLLEAAEMLGAGKASAFVRIILPNILPGTLIASLLSFSSVTGDFVMSNMLVGGQFETIQTYLYHQIDISGQSASAVVVAYFLLIFVLSGIILLLGNWKPKGYKASAKKEEGP